MYFPESEAIARDHSDLSNLVELIDEQLATIFAPSPLRPADFACVFDADENEVVAIFEHLCRQGLLANVAMVECPNCNTLASADEFREAVRDGDDFNCSSCGRLVHRRTPTSVLFKMSDKVLAGTKPTLPKTMADATCVIIEEPLSERGQCALTAMLNLGAINSDRRQPTATIAVEALGKHADANALKAVMADLSTRHLIGTKTGPGGGCWLTDAGLARANKLRQPISATNSAPIAHR